MCPKCKTEKSVCDFSSNRHRKDMLSQWCNKCNNDFRRKIRAEKLAGIYVPKVRLPRLTEQERMERKKELSLYHKNYKKVNAKVLNQKKKEYATQCKLDGILHYGGKCSCCGESIGEFLTLEHLNGRDKTKKRRTGKSAWIIAKREGWPDIYTVLCFNCNCAEGAFGICPHQKKH